MYKSKNLVKKKVNCTLHNGNIEEFTYNGLDKTIGFDGKDINKVVIKNQMNYI